MGQTSNKKFHYAFLVVLVYAIALPAVFLFSNAFGLYMVPITEELGISRGAYSLTQSFNEIVSAVLYFLYARIEKKFKIRYIITAGALSGAIAALLYAISGNLPMIFLASAASGFIWPLFSQVSVGNIVNNWFARKGATIISAMFTFSNLCAFFTSKLVASWIENDGWRSSMLYTMWLILAVTILVFLVIRDRPSDKKLQPWGIKGKSGEEARKQEDASVLPGAEFKSALRSPKLYCAYFWTFITGLIVYPVVYAVPAHLSTVGFDTVFSGDVVGLFSIGSVVPAASRVGNGPLGRADRHHPLRGRLPARHRLTARHHAVDVLPGAGHRAFHGAGDHPLHRAARLHARGVRLQRVLQVHELLGGLPDDRQHPRLPAAPLHL